MAIAKDSISAGDSSPGDTSLTISHTCSGADRLLLVGVSDQGADSVTGVTYNGVAMTQLTKAAGNFGELYVYGLLSPDTGTHNIVVTRTSTTFSLVATNISYTGVSQSGLPDAVATPNTGSTSVTTNVVTVADNSWAFIRVYGGSPAAGTNSTASGTGGDGSGDSFDTYGHGPITPAGSFDMTVTASATIHTCGVSFAPVTLVLNAVVGTFTLTGVTTIFTRALQMVVTVGQFVLTGIDVTLQKGKILTTQVGQFVLTGVDAAVTSARTMATVVGDFTLSGIDVTLLKGKTLNAVVGAFTLTGIAVGFLINGVTQLWTNITKHTASWTDNSKHSSTWTNDNKS